MVECCLSCTRLWAGSTKANNVYVAVGALALGEQTPSTACGVWFSVVLTKEAVASWEHLDKQEVYLEPVY